ncbi:Ribonuclease P protein subunit p21, partial [Mortierella claussenii]
MAKRDRKGGEGAVQNREIFQRMNFLYQAALCMASITLPTVSTGDTGQSQAQKQENETAATPEIHQEDKSLDIPTVQGSLSSSTSTLAHTTDVNMQDATNFTQHTLVAATCPVTISANKRSEERPLRKLSRRQKREQQRLRKIMIAGEQISADPAHHSLLNKARRGLTETFSSKCDIHPLSGTARFYASTLREVGRKNVIRIAPVIKRTICRRCEALLIPSVSCEVRIQGTPQLHTVVTCTSCGVLRRFYCMPGKGIEGDRWEAEETLSATTEGKADVAIEE